MTQVFYASPIIKKKLKLLRDQVNELKSLGHTPFLKVVLVGDDPASKIYTDNKKKFCEKIFAHCEIVKLPSDITPDEFINVIQSINHDRCVHGALIQLPLPEQLTHLNIGLLISPQKDVDGFHDENLICLLKNHHSKNHFTPCTPKGILTLLNFYQIPLKGKHVAVIGRSLIVGKPLAMLLTNLNATVTLCHSNTENLESITHEADIIITAIGKKNFLTTSHISPHKKPIIIDVGINKSSNEEICGDVDFDNVLPLVSGITPVPGGVGKMTILSLCENLIQACRAQIQ